VFIGVLLGSMSMVFGRVERVTVRNLGMMSRFFMATGLMVLGSFPMMFGGLLVMVRRFLMVMVNIVHLRLPACIDARASQMTNDVDMTLYFETGVGTGSRANAQF
jgi:hypothetical protein